MNYIIVVDRDAMDKMDSVDSGFLHMRQRIQLIRPHLPWQEPFGFFHNVRMLRRSFISIREARIGQGDLASDDLQMPSAEMNLEVVVLFLLIESIKFFLPPEKKCLYWLSQGVAKIGIVGFLTISCCWGSDSYYSAMWIRINHSSSEASVREVLLLP